MSYRTDQHLVEKLREILLRLYPTPQASPVMVGSPSLFLSSSNETNGKVETEIGTSDLVLGVVHNYSDTESVTSPTLVLGKVSEFEEGGGDSEGETALTRNLQEFIQILKMSLSLRGEESLSVNEESIPERENLNMEMNSLELNFTIEDITNLNSLLDGSESQIQLRQVVIILLYLVIALVSIVGNALVVQLVIRSRRLHTLTHALLANLAIADLFLAVFNMPFSAARVILAEWPFSSSLCQIVPFVQVMSVYVTSFTMATIAVDRFTVITNPLGRRMKSAHGVLLVLAIWTLSATLSLPFAIYHKVVRVLTVRVVQRCQADFGLARRWITVGTFLAQYFFPLVFTTVSYISIMQKLGERTSLGSTTPRQLAAQSKSKKKTIKMLALTVVFFAVLWAPINAYHLLTHFNIVRHNATSILVCHLIAMSSCTVNPFIYCWFNDHFRREALKWLRCFRTRRCPVVHPGIEVNGMLTRADRVCRTHSTTFGSSSLRSPRLPHSQSHQLQEPLNPSGHGNQQQPFLDYGNAGRDIDVAVRYRERPEALFMVRPSPTDDDIFATATGEDSEDGGQDQFQMAEETRSLSKSDISVTVKYAETILESGIETGHDVESV